MHNVLGFSFSFEIWMGILISHQTIDHIYHRRLTFNALPSNACSSTIWVCSWHDFLWLLSLKLCLKHTFLFSHCTKGWRLHREIKHFKAKRNKAFVLSLSRYLWQQMAIALLTLLKIQPCLHLGVTHKPEMLLIQNCFLVYLQSMVPNYGLRVTTKSYKRPSRDKRPSGVTGLC